MRDTSTLTVRLTKGLVMLPVELIDDNGIHLKECVLKLAKLWNLEEEFSAWLNDACVFTSTLVDRIVTGYPRDEAEELCKEFGYQDNLIVTGEPFALWVIEECKGHQQRVPASGWDFGDLYRQPEAV